MSLIEVTDVRLDKFIGDHIDFFHYACSREVTREVFVQPASIVLGLELDGELVSFVQCNYIPVHFGEKEEMVAMVHSVYTPPEHRNRGYATRICRMLHSIVSEAPWMGEWGSKPEVKFPVCIASMLRSGISPAFYERCTIPGSTRGWQFAGGGCDLEWYLPLSVPLVHGSSEWIYQSDWDEIWRTMASSALPDTVVPSPRQPGSIKRWESLLRAMESKDRPDFPPDQITGVRVGEAAVIFLPGGGEPNLCDWVISSNVDPTLIPLIISKIQEASADCDTLRGVGIDRDTPVGQVMEKLGCKWRAMNGGAPRGVAWYAQETKVEWRGWEEWVD